MQGARGKLLADHDIGSRPHTGRRTRRQGVARLPLTGAPALLSPLPVLPVAARSVTRREELRQPGGEVLAVIFADGLIADPRGYRVEPRFQGGPPLRRVEAVPFGLARPQHGGERPGGSDDLRDRLTPARAGEIVGVLALRQQG